MDRMLIVVNGLARTEAGLSPHPELDFLQSQLTSRRRRWFACAERTAVGWCAALAGAAPAAWLARQAGVDAPEARQLWVASPWSGQVGRDSVHVMPDGMLEWTARDADWLCALLNDLLAGEGMRLLRAERGAALLLACREPLDAYPADFAAVAGARLPDRHPPGRDGGRLMRLLSEIQMLLHGSSLRGNGRQREGRPPVHGLWLWGASPWPAAEPARNVAVRGHHPFLPADEAAGLVVTDAERAREALMDAPPPAAVVLAGAGHAVLLDGWRPGWMSGRWRPKRTRPEGELMRRLVDRA